jgi:Glycosyltransferase 61
VSVVTASKHGLEMRPHHSPYSSFAILFRPSLLLLFSSFLPTSHPLSSPYPTSLPPCSRHLTSPHPTPPLSCNPHPDITSTRISSPLFSFPQVVDTSQMRFSEQLALMRGTNILVGVHGAGLMLIMFAADEVL